MLYAYDATGYVSKQVFITRINMTQEIHQPCSQYWALQHSCRDGVSPLLFLCWNHLKSNPLQVTDQNQTDVFSSNAFISTTTTTFLLHTRLVNEWPCMK